MPEPLRVDATMHTAEIARFTTFVVRGPGEHDCWLWRGCVADDGAGRFWLNRNGVHRVVRPNRYALALAQHLSLGDGDVAKHDVCDLPLCVRAEATGGHIVLGTQSDNLTRKGAHRSRGRTWAPAAVVRARPCRSRRPRQSIA